jgi:hypothetical protein
MKFILHYRITLLLVLLGFFASCEKDSCIHGSGTIVSQSIDIQELNGIDLLGSFNVILKQGPVQKINAVGQQNIVDHLSYRIENGVWKIALQEGCYNDYQLTIELEVPSINELSVSGSGNIQIVDEFDSLENLNLFINSSGEIFANDSLYIASNLIIDISGSGSVTMIGSASDQTINISGSGNYNAFSMLSDAAVVSISGSGNCEVNVLNDLNVFLSGSGNIYYINSPLINSTITGSGVIINAN